MFFGMRFRKAEAKPLYIHRPVLNGDDIAQWYRDQGCTPVVDPSDMHVTVLYSKTPVQWDSMGSADDTLTLPPDDARNTHPLGDKGAQVLSVTSPHLQDRHTLLRALGASSDYPAYQPHVTVSYDGHGFDKAKPWAGEIKLGPEQFEEITSDWKPTLNKADHG